MKNYEFVPYIKFGDWAAIQRVKIRLELPANETTTDVCNHIRKGLGVIFSTKCGDRKLTHTVYFSDWVRLRNKKKDELWYEEFVSDWNTGGGQT